MNTVFSILVASAFAIGSTNALADETPKVTRDYCKFGKTRNLGVRRRSYEKTFGKENVNFFVIAELADIDTVEQRVLEQLDKVRVRGDDVIPGFSSSSI